MGKTFPSYMESALASRMHCSDSCHSTHTAGHDNNHSQLCPSLARKSLYRIGRTLQAIWYGYREVVFDKHAAMYEKRGFNLLVYNKETNIKHMMDILQPFPAHCFENEEDKHRILVHLSCDDAVAWMTDIMRYLLKDLNCYLQEVIITNKGWNSTIIEVDHMGNEDTNRETDHIFVKVTMKDSDEEYALDLTGAQYGYFDPVVAYDDYAKERIAVEKDLINWPRSHGKSKQEFEEKAKQIKDGFSGDTHVLLTALNLEVHRAMMICIKDWEEKEQLTWMDIVPESDEFYTMCEKQLVEAIQKHARVIIEKMKEVRENFELKNADEMTERGTTGVNVEELDST